MPKYESFSHKWVILCVLLLVLVAHINTAFCSIKKEKPQEQAGTLSFSLSDYIVPEKELIEERTATSKTYEIDRGNFISEISTRPIHYSDDGKNWNDIVCAIRPNADQVYPYANLTNQIKSYFPSGSAGSIKCAYKDIYFTYKTLVFTSIDSTGEDKIIARAGEVPISVRDSVAAFSNLLPFASEEFVVLPWGIEERLVIEEPILTHLQGNERTVGALVRLKLSQGLSLVSAKGELGSYWKGNERLFVMKGSDTIFVFEPPVAFDSQKSKVACEYEWKFFSGELLLSVRLPANWLKDQARAFPVTIDPTIYLYSSSYGQTGYVAKLCSGRDWLGNCTSWSYTNYYSSIWCGSYASHDDEYRGWAEWSLSSIPIGSIVNDTQIRFYSIYTHFEGGDWTFVDLYQMSYRPSGASAQTVFDDAYNGTRYTYLYCTSTGQFYYSDLGSSADYDLQNKISAGWFAVGGKDEFAPSLLDEVDYAGYSYSSSYQPRLYVAYTLPYCNNPSSITIDNPCYQTVSGTISSYGWRTYQFSAKANNTYKFSFCDDGGGAGFDTYLALYSSSCEEITHDDDGCGYPYSRLTWTPTSDMTANISVQGYGSSSGYYNMAYRIEPTSISPTTSWNTVSGSISSNGYHWYSFTAQADMIYEFSFCAGGGSASWDTYLELYPASCGSRIAYDDDGCGYPNAYLSWLSPGAGTYYLKLRGFAGASGSYVLAYRKMSPYISVTIQTSMSGGTVIVDGITYASPYTTTWRIGTSHTIGVVSPQLESGGSRYVFSSWSDGGGQTHSVTASASVTTYTANFIRQYRLTVYSSHDAPSPPVGEYWYNANTYITATVSPIADESGGVRYRCSGYTGTGSCPSGSGTSVSFNINSPTSITWNWVQQFRLIVQGNPSPHDSPSPGYGERWYDAGTNIVATVGSPADEAGGTRWRCTGYSGSGSVGSGSGTYVAFSIYSPSTLTWNWLAQYQLTMSTNWGTISPGTGWYDQGSYVSIQAFPAPVVDGERGIWLGWIGSGSGSYSGTANPVGLVINAPISESATWDHQFRLIVYNDRPYGNPNPAAGEHWYTAGSSIYACIDSIANETGSSRLRCTGFIGTGSVPASSSNVRVSFNINAPSTIRWRWVVQYLLTMSTNFGEVSPGTSWQDSAQVVSISATPPATIDGERYLWLGWSGTGTGSYTGMSNPANINVLSPVNEVGTWDHQYRLTVVSEFGSPVPSVGEHWFTQGTNVLGSVDSIAYSPDSTTRHFCTGYIGTGSLGSGTGRHFSFVINQPSSVTWQWTHQYQFTVYNPGDHGSPSPRPGSYWYDEGAFISGYNNNYELTSDPNVRWRCAGFTATGSLSSSTDTSFSFRIYAPTTLTWNWVQQYTFRVSSIYGSPTPPAGTHWYDNGTEIVARVDSATGESEGTRFRCSGFTGTGSTPAHGDSFVVNFVISMPSTITWEWLLQYSFVVSGNPGNYGSPSPGYGTNWFDAGATIFANSNSPTEGAGGVRYRCIGFTGTGSTPSSGTSTSVTLTLRGPSTIRWNWRTQYFLDMETNAGSCSPGDGWYDDGTTVRISATPPTAIDGERFSWIGWAGTGAGSYSGTLNPVEITMVGPITETARWRHEFRLIVEAGEHGSPNPPAGTHWYDAGTVVYASNDSVILLTPTMRWGCTGWSGTGSVPARGDSSRVSFSINAPSSITWQWGLEYYIRLSYVGTGGATVTQRGEGWHARYTWTSVYTSPFTVSGTETLYFAGWTTDPPGGRLLNDYANSTDVFVDTSRIFIAHYASAFTATIIKNPRQSFGDIIVDGTPYRNTDSISVRWAFGSVHTISVSQVDYASGDTLRYVFDNWSDGGGITHNIGPITHDYVLIANYHKEYKCVVRKEPPEDVGWLGVDRELYNHSESVYQEFWWAHNSIHLLEVSSADSMIDRYYLFDRWSDGGAVVHYTEPITAPKEFVAYYITKFRFIVQKVPAERYGWILINGTQYDSTSSVYLWANPGDTLRVGVSTIDLGPDTIYYFREWSDGGDSIHTVGPITAPVSLSATYAPYRYQLAICLSSNRWNIGRISCGERVTMSPGEEIRVTNCGNFTYDLGLQVTAPGEIWQAGYFNGLNTFVLRARFEEGECGSFRPAQDLVKMSTITWATPTIFGPGGYNIPPCIMGDCDQNLWLQFIAPTQSSNYYPQVIRMTISARPHLP